MKMDGHVDYADTKEDIEMELFYMLMHIISILGDTHVKSAKSFVPQKMR